MKTVMKKYQFLIFLLLTFLFSWFPWYAGIAPEVMAMGPSLAAFLVVLIVAAVVLILVSKGRIVDTD